MIVLVGGEKGGSGKSCLAQNLAVYLQTTTTDWAQEREDNDGLVSLASVQASGNVREGKQASHDTLAWITCRNSIGIAHAFSSQTQ